VISEALFLTGYIEKWGTGINKMNRLMQDLGLPLPEYDEIGDNFLVILKRKVELPDEQVSKIAGALATSPKTPGNKAKTEKSVTIPMPKSSEKSSEKGSEKSSEKILALLKEIPDASAKELAKEIGITPRAVEKNIAALKRRGLLKRIGPDKGGHWVVLKHE